MVQQHSRRDIQQPNLPIRKSILLDPTFDLYTEDVNAGFACWAAHDRMRSRDVAHANHPGRLDVRARVYIYIYIYIHRYIYIYTYTYICMLPP